jgi:Fur family transcriptional regulator, ferric uptake regulator
MSKALELIQAQAQTPTSARVLVLDTLLSASLPLSHPEIQKQITEPIDRVTIYRVLDWLSTQGFVHSVISPDKTRRFKASTQHTQHQHAHFECTACGQVYCLDEANDAITQSLPKHFVATAIHLNISGICAACQH